MRLTIAVLASLLSMHSVGALIFSVMIMVVFGIIDIMHHKTMVDLKLARIISDIERACETTKINVVKS